MEGGSVVLELGYPHSAFLLSIPSLGVAETGMVGRNACTLPLRPKGKALGVGSGFEKCRGRRVQKDLWRACGDPLNPALSEDHMRAPEIVPCGLIFVVMT